MTFQTNFKRRGKYNASKQVYGGSRYDSGKEARHAELLDQLKKAANPAQRVERWDRQVKVSFDYNGKHICNWYCDFHVFFADGHDEWHEVKGLKTDVYRLKEKLFLAFYPERVLLII